MRNIIFRGRENTADIGIEFDGDFSLLDLSHVTVEFGGQEFSSQDGSVIIDGEVIRIDVGADADLPADGWHSVTVTAYSPTYPNGFILAYPCSGLEKIRVLTVSDDADGPDAGYPVLEMTAGVEFALGWRFKQLSGAAFDLTGYSILTQIKLRKSSPTAIDSFTELSSEIDFVPALGSVDLLIPPSVTAGYDFSSAVIDCWAHNDTDTDGARSVTYAIRFDRGVSGL